MEIRTNDISIYPFWDTLDRIRAARISSLKIRSYNVAGG